MSQLEKRRSERIWQRKRGRRLERTSHHSIYLAHELVVAILWRSPPKSLLRFRCVCKSWNSLISSPNFISSHLRNNNTQPLLHQWCVEDGGRASIRLSHVEDNHVDERLLLDFGFETPHINLQVIGSAGGLICYIGVQIPQTLISKFIIFNPEIKCFLSVPPPLPSINSWYVKGFGFEDTTLDYKIILAAEGGYVYLYSLNTNSWKFLSCQISWGTTVETSAIFVKDCFHWLTYENYQHSWMSGTHPDHKPCILVFDIKTETFRRILFSEHLLGHLQIIAGFDESSISVVQNLRRSRSTLIHVWSMDQNGLWFKIADDVKVDKRAEVKQVLGFRNKDELIIKLYKRRVIVSQSIEDKVVHHVASIELHRWYHKVHGHVPSLALLDKMVA